MPLDPNTMNYMKIKRFPMVCAVISAIFVAVSASCSGAGRAGSGGEAAASAEEPMATVAVSADSLYGFVEQQVALGPRTPGSEGHARCVEYITTALRRYGVDTVTVEGGKATTWEGKQFDLKNIFAQINGDASNRVLLLAHYDTRPWADEDPDAANHSKAIDGANDGGSGVAVLLEVARVLGRQLPDSLGVDLLFVDLEDSGETGGDEDTWCLGTQQWVKNMPYTSANRPRYGILLDMVGGRDAKFHREYFSQRHASPVVDKVWSIARRSGLGERFVNSNGGGVVDDHLHINGAGIPCIDIIENMNEHTGSFNPSWHTMDDSLQAIDRTTLRDAAQVVVNTLLNP